MGIEEDDIARVRAATDFVALVSEHIALKRVGRQYQGLCPFHSEKSPSFSINPEKGVYYCYGCQASGDAISFIRQLEHLDFSQAVEKLAAKANITLRYSSENVNRDRAKRTKLVAAMEAAVEWYHQQLLSGPESGAARAYLRSRGYDGELIRRFKIGYAPKGWDSAVKALSLPTEVARDTGLGYLNKIGKVNDFFQNRILFPIYDHAGSPVAFGGRKLPDDDGPKYKNSSETKLYSKSRTLYGLNWAKTNIVERGEVIVCEGYTDVIGFHTAGLPRAVATCGTALADEHFKLLKNYARKIVLAYDADNAGQNAAAKFYAWEKAYEIDLFVVSLPQGADPADLARHNPQLLHDAVTNAKPFLAFRVERVLQAANLTTAEGRAKAFAAAVDVVAMHPNPIVREQYVREIAARCQVSDSQMFDALAVAEKQATQSKRNSQGTGRQHENGSRPGRPEERKATFPDSSAPTERPVRNEEWTDRPPDESLYRRAEPTRSRPRSEMRATSHSLRAEAIRARSMGAEQELLRWLLADPEQVSGWIRAVLFSDELQRETALLFVATGGLHEAIDHAERLDREDIANLLRRLAVDSPRSEEVADALAIVVSNTADRVIATISARRDEAQPEEVQAIGDLKRLQSDLRDPDRRSYALIQLVPWLSEWHAHQQETDS